MHTKNNSNRIKPMRRRTSLLKEFWLFMKENKAYWIAPIIIVSLFLAAILFLASVSPAAAPFIYTLF